VDLSAAHLTITAQQGPATSSATSCAPWRTCSTAARRSAPLAQLLNRILAIL
jgi:hypothetical protein